MNDHFRYFLAGILHGHTQRLSQPRGSVIYANFRALLQIPSNYFQCTYLKYKELQGPKEAAPQPLTCSRLFTKKCKYISSLRPFSALMKLICDFSTTQALSVVYDNRTYPLKKTRLFCLQYCWFSECNYYNNVCCKALKKIAFYTSSKEQLKVRYARLSTTLRTPKPCKLIKCIPYTHRNFANPYEIQKQTSITVTLQSYTHEKERTKKKQYFLPRALVKCRQPAKKPATWEVSTRLPSRLP